MMEELAVATADTQPQVLTEAVESIAAPNEGDTLEVKFNKQTHRLSREDAVRYAQMGMKYDAVMPLLNTLKEVAAAEGKTLNEWVGAAKSHKPQSPDEALVARLAQEYTALCREVPTVGAFDTLPDDVVRTAVCEGVSLYDAYLRFEHRERCRIEAERASAAAARDAATGSMAGEALRAVSSAENAMLRGIWGR